MEATNNILAQKGLTEVEKELLFSIFHSNEAANRLVP